VVVLAGGQGSRLGFEHPKGMYCVPGLDDKSIFQFLTERFFRVQMNATSTNKIGPALKCKMLVLTSRENHEETQQFFADNKYFGGHAGMFEFFQQAMLPALDLQGRILMHSPYQIKLAPNGNGGFFNSIATLPHIREYIESLEYVQVIGVDNIMNKILDPV
jgi:UDP-N-acetylglucosamine/UDP-N-acetylgalactosamine diphosphorylase